MGSYWIVDLVVSLTLCNMLNSSPKFEFTGIKEYGVDMPGNLIRCPFLISTPNYGETRTEVPHFLRVAEDGVNTILPSGDTTYIFSPTCLLPPGSKFDSDKNNILLLIDEARLDFTTSIHRRFFSRGMMLTFWMWSKGVVFERE